MSAKRDDSRSKSKQSETLWNFLNKPVGFDSLLDVLKRDLTSVGAESESRMLPNLDKQAEELIERASAIAESEGITIEEALARFGIGLDDDDDSGAPENVKDSMLRSLDWEVTHVDDTVENPKEEHTPLRRRTDVLDALSGHMEIDTTLLQDILEQVSADDPMLRDRLIFFGFCTDFQYAEARQRAISGGLPIWYTLLSDMQSDVSQFAEVLRVMAFAPALVPGKGSFYEWLLDKGPLNYKMYKEARVEALREKISICEVLSRPAFLGGKAYIELMQEFSGLDGLNGAKPVATLKLAAALDREWLELFDLAPVRIKGQTVTIGVSRPLTREFSRRLAASTGATIAYALMTPDALKSYKKSLLDKIVEHKPALKPTEKSAGRIKEIVASASAVNLVRQLFEGALDSRATDIHIDPHADGAWVRFRIDGMLHEVMRMETELSTEVASRIKILADMDITERRRPQDGHISVNIRGTEYDMRIATVPARNGEKIAIRLVYAGNVMKPLGELGLIASDYKKMQSFIKLPFGMILATGPVGSGKTTTLYSCLNEVNRQVLNVMSVEDPVEFDLDNANQVPVNYQLQFGFVEGLRALLRQDPDIILVGEIRDEETARIAVRASMTGLLVFSTLHTNDAPGAITTLTNFHIPNHLIANSLVGVIAQRLLRRICMDCRETYKPDKETLLRMGFKADKLAGIKKLHRGKGCPTCFTSGYLGRTGVFEVMEVTPNLKDLILEGVSEKVLRNTAIEEGMRTLAMDGREKVLAGQISSEEFFRILRA
jgi:type II secretory ATPase GspE/PulE/Tfp pilus assembly ATPase PilB-like protein